MAMTKSISPKPEIYLKHIQNKNMDKFLFCCNTGTLQRVLRKVSVENIGTFSTKLGVKFCLRQTRNEKTMKILLIEDDLSLQETILQMLEKAGYSTIACADGDEGLYYMQQNSCDAVILDRMLPGLDGLSVLQRAREQKIATPVLMLTALDAIGDRVNGLQNGADDYLGKPFDMRELLARVAALIRRPAPVEEIQELRFANIALILQGMLLQGPKGEARLTKKQCDLLELFLRSPSQTLTRATMFSRVWGPDADVDENVIDTYISVLRRRLKTVGAGAEIVTNRGVGYQLREKA